MTLDKPLTNGQLEILKAFSHELSEGDLLALRRTLARFFADRARDEVDRLWEERGWTEETMHAVARGKGLAGALITLLITTLLACAPADEPPMLLAVVDISEGGAIPAADSCSGLSVLTDYFGVIEAEGSITDVLDAARSLTVGDVGEQIFIRGRPDHSPADIKELQRDVQCRYLLFLHDENGATQYYPTADLVAFDSAWIDALSIPCGYYISSVGHREYQLYRHESRVENDSATIKRKSFPWLNRYKVITEYKRESKTHYLEYNLACGYLEEEFYFTKDAKGNTYKYDSIDSLLFVQEPTY